MLFCFSYAIDSITALHDFDFIFYTQTILIANWFFMLVVRFLYGYDAWKSENSQNKRKWLKQVKMTKTLRLYRSTLKNRFIFFSRSRKIFSIFRENKRFPQKTRPNCILISISMCITTSQSQRKQCFGEIKCSRAMLERRKKLEHWKWNEKKKEWSTINCMPTITKLIVSKWNAMGEKC